MGLLYTGIGWGLNSIFTKNLVDVLTFTAGSENVRGTTSVSTEKMAMGVGFSNYLYNQPMQISLIDVVLKNYFSDTDAGEYDKGYSVTILEALRLQQIFIPIFIKCSVFTGLVQMLSYDAGYEDGTVGINLEFQELPLFKPFITASVVGAEDSAISVKKEKTGA